MVDRDPNWETVRANSSIQYDIDHNLHFWQIYISVRVGSMLYWSEQIVFEDDVEDVIKTPELFACLLKEMIQTIDDRIKENSDAVD